MSEATARRGRLLSGESLAGWIFADLLLVLFIVGLGSAMAYDPPEPPKPEPKRAPIVGMKTDPVSVVVDVDGGVLSRGIPLRPPERERVCRAVRERLDPVTGQRSALVLVFGGASDVSAGQNVARAVAGQLGCADKKVFAGKVPTRAFWDGTLPLGRVRLEIFLFITGERGSRS